MTTAFTWLIVLSMAATPAGKAKTGFQYDPADETIRATMIGDDRAYEPSMVVLKDRLWITWLEFEPGKGDRIWVGCREISGSDWLSQKAITEQPSIYRNPTLTADKAGRLWLSFEQQDDETWSVKSVLLHLDGNIASSAPDDTTSDVKALTSNRGINHRTAVDPKDGIWMICQTPEFNTFKVTHLTHAGATHVGKSEDIPLFPNGHAWHPDITVLPDGEVCIVFDANEGGQTGFDTYLMRRSETEGKCKWSVARVLAATDAFEGRARIISDATGRMWTLWEEGNPNWGSPYRARKYPQSTNEMILTDNYGPLHSFRWLHINELIGKGRTPLDPPLPMPALDILAQRSNAPKGVQYIGGYYERGEFSIDGLGRLWVVYRHFFAPWEGCKKNSHVQQDWGMYARCYDGKSWSRLFRCSIGQGDGMQRLSVAALPDGIAMVYCTGRTDRRPSDSPINIALATIHLPGEPASYEPTIGTVAELPVHEPAKPATPEYNPYGDFQVVFGDLHRHTDLSLCAVPVDGTIEDAYRYAIDAARLDFLGVTDHSRDIAMGKESSLLWWRCRKEVSRHTLAPRFIGMYAYEHSRGGEDHNVISLRPDLLRTDAMPFPELWRQMDNDTFTIPHQTFCNPVPPNGETPLSITEKTWSYRDDAHRPLFEIYQGARDRVIDRDAHIGLSKGHIFGFIASSDHMSTGASFAGVWTEQRTRESIFRSMQARRTFGATAKISLRMMMGNHWMGEQVTAGDLGTVYVSAKGTATIEKVDLIVDGRVNQDLLPSKKEIELSFRLPEFVADQATADGIHYFYVRLKQSDGNLAWSSPIWVRN